MACILLWSSAVRVHNSQAYRKMDVTRERISRILELREILQSFQTSISLVNAALVYAIQKICSVVFLPALTPACTSAMIFSAFGFNLFRVIFSMTLLGWLMRLIVK